MDGILGVLEGDRPRTHRRLASAERPPWLGSPVRGAATGTKDACAPTKPHKQRALKRVLVVDDDPDICGLFGWILTGAGFEVELADDGERGLAAARATQPDAIVLDWMLPSLTGIEICRMLRADPATAQTRIMILSARAGAADLVQSHAAGADDHLAKPVARRELIRRVRALVGD
jgi:CheY-like chemotaxis protein